MGQRKYLKRWCWAFLRTDEKHQPTDSSQIISRRVNTKSLPGHILMKLENTKDKEMEKLSEDRLLTEKGKSDRLTYQ